MELTDKTDEELVISSFNKDTVAFEEIVKRYQSLVCSVAYNAIGDLGLSEDLAQETFIIAWKKLSDLKNPSKLKSWLCAIIRNLVHSYIRKEKRQPTSQAIPISDGFYTVCVKQSPNQEAISREEEAILWDSLDRIPDKYREPMVLFYREDNSIRKVADLLELSEDVVRQRLFRGRVLLREEVALFVENTLKRSRPQRRFTIGVMTSLPVASPKAVITTATSVGGVVKAASGAGLLGSFFGFLGTILGVWCDFKSAKTVSEKKFVIRGSGIGFGVIILFMVLFFHIPALATAWHLNYWDLLGAWIGLFIGCIICWQRWYINKRTRLHHEGNGVCYPKQDAPILVEKEWRKKTGKDLLNPQLRFFLQTASLLILICGLISIWILFQYGLLDLSFINSPFGMTIIPILSIGFLCATGISIVWRILQNPFYTSRYKRFQSKWVIIHVSYISIYLGLIFYFHLPGRWMSIMGYFYMFGLAGLLAKYFHSHGRMKHEDIVTGSPEFSIPFPEKPIVITRQKGLFMNYSVFFGMICWLAVVSSMVMDWHVLTFLIAVFLVVPYMNLKFFSPHLWRVLFYDLVFAGILNLSIVNLRWNRWMETYRNTRFYDPMNDRSLWLMNAILIPLFVILSLFAFSKWKKHDKQTSG